MCLFHWLGISPPCQAGTQCEKDHLRVWARRGFTGSTWAATPLLTPTPVTPFLCLVLRWGFPFITLSQSLSSLDWHEFILRSSNLSDVSNRFIFGVSFYVLLEEHNQIPNWVLQVPILASACVVCGQSSGAASAWRPSYMCGVGGKMGDKLSSLSLGWGRNKLRLMYKTWFQAVSECQLYRDLFHVLYFLSLLVDLSCSALTRVQWFLVVWQQQVISFVKYFYT